jgi:hypothetical protein
MILCHGSREFLEIGIKLHLVQSLVRRTGNESACTQCAENGREDTFIGGGRIVEGAEPFAQCKCKRWWCGGHAEGLIYCEPQRYPCTGGLWCEYCNDTMMCLMCGFTSCFSCAVHIARIFFLCEGCGDSRCSECDHGYVFCDKCGDFRCRNCAFTTKSYFKGGFTMCDMCHDETRCARCVVDFSVCSVCSIQSCIKCAAAIHYSSCGKCGALCCPNCAADITKNPLTVCEACGILRCPRAECAGDISKCTNCESTRCSTGVCSEGVTCPTCDEICCPSCADASCDRCSLPLQCECSHFCCVHCEVRVCESCTDSYSRCDNWTCDAVLCESCCAGLHYCFTCHTCYCCESCKESHKCLRKKVPKLL